MLDAELRQILRELVAEIGADSAAISHRPEDAEAGAPLGNGAYLVVSGDSQKAEHDAAVERVVRAVRSCARRWTATRLPDLVVGAGAPRANRIRERIETFLRALVADQSAENAIVTLRGEVVAAATEPGELQRERVPFTVKRLEAEAGRGQGKTSHAEIDGDDYYAVSFWYEAALIIFFSAPFSLDFVRHRARRVVAEVSAIIGDIDEPPPQDPAKVAPVPE
jgi:hypothetical protein